MTRYLQGTPRLRPL